MFDPCMLGLQVAVGFKRGRSELSEAVPLPPPLVPPLPPPKPPDSIPSSLPLFTLPSDFSFSSSDPMETATMSYSTELSEPPEPPPKTPESPRPRPESEEEARRCSTLLIS